MDARTKKLPPDWVEYAKVFVNTYIEPNARERYLTILESKKRRRRNQFLRYVVDCFWGELDESKCTVWETRYHYPPEMPEIRDTIRQANEHFLFPGPLETDGVYLEPREIEPFVTEHHEDELLMLDGCRVFIVYGECDFALCKC